MNYGMLSVRYVKALFLLAKERNELDTVHCDLKSLKKLIDENADFKLFLENPSINTTQKQQITTTILSEKIASTTLRFVQTLIQNKRESILKNCCLVFMQKYREYSGEKEAQLATASPIDTKTYSLVKMTLEESLKSKINLETYTDKELIGGFVLQIEGKQLDCSIASKLNAIKQELLSK